MAGKIRIHRNDNVEVIAGTEKGKRGEVVKVLQDKNKVIIRGLNMVKKAMRKRNQQDQGGIVEIEAPISASNVMILCKKCGKTRIAYEIEDGKKKRVCRKCGEAL
ncbi:50S ribosomal protein L24 [Treponema pedis]|uniref:50S ribosomal protein L24 n=1 Tax=Treponema pedis TaxID=409322 RepID=UPI00041F4843|nr:50S ribosomal protein L24 [Treponema pedis]